MSVLELLAALAAMLCAPADALAAPRQGVEVLRVGQWVKVKGALDQSGLFVAGEIEVLPPEEDQTLTGTVERLVDRERFMILGQRVRLAADTRWRKLSLGDLEGARIRVEGSYRGPRNFKASEIAARGPGRDEIEGRIDRLELEGAYLRLVIMDFRVLVAPDTDVEHTLPLAEIPLAPERLVSPEDLATDDDDELPGTIQLADELTLGGQIELEAEREDNFDLNDANAADQEDYDASARLRLVWGPSPDFFAVLGGRFEYFWRRDEDDGNSHGDDAVLNEVYVYWREALDLGWDVEFGRQDFEDQREWLYDRKLDALRLIRSTPDYRLELSASTNLSDASPLDESVNNLIAYLSNNSLRRHAGAYVIDRSDEDDPGEHSTHAGARLLGEWIPSARSWLELCSASGELGGVDLGGWGFDLGSTWLPDVTWLPDLTLGYAWGGESFRQTGLQDDNDKWGGVTSFHYYGELVDPELANLSILTAGIGKRLTRDSSLDLVFHKFDQVEPAAQLIHTELRRQPDGVHTDLGWEADLVFGSRAIPRTHLEAVLGYFEPGAAFPGADPAWSARLQIRFRF